MTNFVRASVTTSASSATPDNLIINNLHIGIVDGLGPISHGQEPFAVDNFRWHHAISFLSDLTSY
jgi:hypothetical protein